MPKIISHRVTSVDDLVLILIGVLHKNVLYSFASTVRPSLITFGALDSDVRIKIQNDGIYNLGTAAKNMAVYHRRHGKYPQFTEELFLYRRIKHEKFGYIYEYVTKHQTLYMGYSKYRNEIVINEESAGIQITYKPTYGSHPVDEHVFKDTLKCIYRTYCSGRIYNQSITFNRKDEFFEYLTQ